jgi:hypothetical protein
MVAVVCANAVTLASAAKATRVYCIFTINMKNLIDLITDFIFIEKVTNKLYLCIEKKISNTLLFFFVTNLLKISFKKMTNLKIIKFIIKIRLKVQTYALRTTNTRRY